MKRLVTLLVAITLVLGATLCTEAQTYFQLSNLEVTGAPTWGGSFLEYNERTGEYSYTGEAPFDPGILMAYSGQVLKATCEVTNISAQAGEVAVNLYVDGIVAESRMVSVDASGTVEVEFEFGYSRPGDHNVTIGNLTPRSIKVADAIWNAKLIDLKFDEGGGLTAKDSSGFGFDVEIQNPEWVEGYSGYALNFTKKYPASATLMQPAPDFSEDSFVDLPFGPNDVGKTGSFSFWYMPNWSTDDWYSGSRYQHVLVEATRKRTGRAFVLADGEEFAWMEFTFEDSADVDFEGETDGTDQPSSEDVRPDVFDKYSVQHKFEAGKWYYITASWKMVDDEVFEDILYINGEKYVHLKQVGAYMGGYDNFRIGLCRAWYWFQGSAEGIIDEFSVIPYVLDDEQARMARYSEEFKHSITPCVRIVVVGSSVKYS